MLNETGIDIGNGTEGPLAHGTPVDAASLPPGDPVSVAGM